MVGEMRDRDTAELAIKLANTGHLTFSTLHTNDAPSAVSRLFKMGIEPFLIAYAINLVVAQRLVRTVCPTCRRRDPDPDPVLLGGLGFSEAEIADTAFYQAGTHPTCRTCGGSGYKGRQAIAEALYFSRAIRHLIVESDVRVDEDAIRDTAIAEGMLSLVASAREVVKRGDTTIDELIRVVSTE
jgi:type IV pilus assembly protein PilB